ncbi:MAG: nuclear transport factor 2 family protein [Phycisphaeraceae bacterium]|nr:MAG: nuclear transport factor 2 family protein [Phycisphaeraceae bacterium]
MDSRVLLSAGVVAWLGAAGCDSTEKREAERAAATAALNQRAAVIERLDAMHAAAAKADLPGYMACFAPDAVFLGTDSSERWPMGDFAKFCEFYFKQDKGWDYRAIPGRRFVSFSPDASMAWFDEALTNDNLGECRGSGVLRRSPAGWQVVQYNLTIPVPNELAPRVVQLIRERGPGSR